MSDEKKLSERVREGEFQVILLGEGIGWVTNTEALDDIADEIAALEKRLAEAEADLSRLNVVADTVCHDPQGIGPSAVMFKQCKRIAELERELTEARKDAERYRWLCLESFYTWSEDCGLGLVVPDVSNAKGDIKTQCDEAIDAAMR